MRARIVLLVAEGLSNTAIAGQLHTVGKNGERMLALTLESTLTDATALAGTFHGQPSWPQPRIDSSHLAGFFLRPSSLRDVQAIAWTATARTKCD